MGFAFISEDPKSSLSPNGEKDKDKQLSGFLA
jgi:hypothetical protein